MERLPAAKIRQILSTVGAGDALFACFLHYVHAGLPPLEALRMALLVASYEMGETGGVYGYLTQAELDALDGKQNQGWV